MLALSKKKSVLFESKEVRVYVIKDSNRVMNKYSNNSCRLSRNYGSNHESNDLRNLLCLDLKKLSNRERNSIVVEEKSIAEEIHKSASLLGELQCKNTSSQFKHIKGSVPMPLSLIYRLDEDQISTRKNDTTLQLFNFIIRSHYKPLYEMCVVKRNGVIGTPGIAKSVSLLYPLLDHFLKSSNSPADAPPVLLHSVARDEAHLFIAGSCWNIRNFMTNSTFGYIHSDIQDLPELLYLVDGPTGIKSHIGATLKGVGSKTILVSSPEKDNYHEFLKQGIQFILPCWSLEELLEARSLVNPDVTEDEVKDRYYKVGGVIRGVLTSKIIAKEYFRRAEQALDLEKRSPNILMKVVDSNCGNVTIDIGEVGYLLHFIYHFEVNPITFESTKVIFASKWIKSNLDPIRYRK